MITLVARHQFLALRRQRLLTALLGILLVMTALAAVIGWSSHQTIIKVYNEATALAVTDGSPAPPNPFRLKPTLSLLSNMSIYIVMVGALLAVVVGHLSLADDATSGVGRLVHTRPVTRRHHLAGTMIGVGAALGLAVLASLAVSAVALPLVNGSLPTVAEYLRLIVFYGLSWLYLLVFALVGMVTVLLGRRRSYALLSAMGVWLVLTFAVPQFTSGANPVSSLNPISNPVSTSQTIFAVTARARPASITEQFKAASAQILQTTTAEPVQTTAVRVLPLAVALAGLAAAADHLARGYDHTTGAHDV